MSLGVNTWNTVNDILFPVACPAPKYYYACFHLQAGGWNTWMNETLEETKHFQSSVEGVGGATDDMEWHGGGAANKQFQQLNEQRWTWNTQQQTLND